MIDRSGTRIRNWLSNDALPLWASEGVDAECGGFVERLMPHAVADLFAIKRVRVQARQLYVFSHASLLGLNSDAADIALQGYRFLADHACPQGVDAGFVHALSREGQVVSDWRDSYDHAFVLFALSWYYRASGEPEVRILLRQSADAAWRLLRHPSGEGFLIDTRGALDLHQNPHMHLLEAVLAAYDATEDPYFLDRAEELFRLFRHRMFDSKCGVLREFYDAGWHPAANEIIEPGHHCEWVWLLKRYGDRVGAPLCEEAWQLYNFAERHGRPGDGILLCDETRADGSILKANTRCWPQTEAVKADVAIAEARGVPLSHRTDAIVDALFSRFLDPAPAGGWIDWLDADGAPLTTTIPASTFYHLFLAFSEYLAANDAG